MARLKHAVDPAHGAEIRRLLEQFKQGFLKDLLELEHAKRNFSSSFVQTIITQFESLVPEHVLNMKAIDFLDAIEKDEYDATNPPHSTINKGKEKPKHFFSVMTPAGVKVEIPPYIRTRVTGAILEPRASRFEEVLFSVHGTPVMGASNDMGFVGDASMTRKKKMITQLLQQCDAEISPATKKIVQQLTSVILSNAKKMESKVKK